MTTSPQQFMVTAPSSQENMMILPTSHVMHYPASEQAMPSYNQHLQIPGGRMRKRRSTPRQGNSCPTSPAFNVRVLTQMQPFVKPDLHNPTGGKLVHFARLFVCQAYGLEGINKRTHADIIRDAQAITGCSDRAIQEVIYGHSYNEELASLRLRIPGYPPKARNKERLSQLDHILSTLEHQAFYHYDGNDASDVAPTTCAAAAPPAPALDATDMLFGGLNLGSPTSTTSETFWESGRRSYSEPNSPMCHNRNLSPFTSPSISPMMSPPFSPISRSRRSSIGASDFASTSDIARDDDSLFHNFLF